MLALLNQLLQIDVVQILKLGTDAKERLRIAMEDVGNMNKN